MTLKEKLKAYELKRERRELLVEKLTKYCKLLGGIEVAGILDINPATVSRIKNEKQFNLSSEKVEEYLTKLGTN